MHCYSYHFAVGKGGLVKELVNELVKGRKQVINLHFIRSYMYGHITCMLHKFFANIQLGQNSSISVAK